MALLLYLGDKKRAFPSAFKRAIGYVVFPIVAGLTSYFGLQQQKPPQFWTNHLQNHTVSYAATRSFVVSTGCSFASFLVLRVFLPLSFFVPHAFAMRSMGLLEATLER